MEGLNTALRVEQSRRRGNDDARLQESPDSRAVPECPKEHGAASQLTAKTARRDLPADWNIGHSTAQRSAGSP